MNVLVIGSGGREHAICRALSRSRRLTHLFVLPGNAGTAQHAVNLPGDPCDIEQLVSIARRHAVGLTIVGPEDPLAAGVADAFERAGLRVFGPCAAAARLESDKAYAKQLMRQAGVPTAEARIFAPTGQDRRMLDGAEEAEAVDPLHPPRPTAYSQAYEYVSTRDAPVVVKASGLARGKGAFVCDDPAEALLVLERLLVKRELGAAGQTVVVEERLQGREVSVLALVDGRNIYVLEPAQDYKRLRDGDAGPNTGGMGAYCPSTALDDATMQRIEREIFVPIVDALRREGVVYRGVLYAGIMLTPGGPKVLEFNCRFGDPEAQVQLMRLRSDLIDACEATIDGRLDRIRLDWDPRAAVCVVMASKGYPDDPETGKPIRGLPDVGGRDDLAVFHAGTRREGEQVLTAGGRVLGVTALGETLAAARATAYETVGRIHFDGAHYRRDIGAPDRT